MHAGETAAPARSSWAASVRLVGARGRAADEVVVARALCRGDTGACAASRDEVSQSHWLCGAAVWNACKCG